MQRKRLPRQRPLPVPTMKEYMRSRQRQAVSAMFDVRAHERTHGPTTLVYQTATTLDTNAGPKLRLPRGGQITKVSCKLQGAPVTNPFKVDLKVDNTTVFESGTYLQVQAGETVSRGKIVERPYFSDESTFVVQINTISSATGPMVMTIEYLPEY